MSADVREFAGPSHIETLHFDVVRSVWQQVGHGVGPRVETGHRDFQVVPCTLGQPVVDVETFYFNCVHVCVLQQTEATTGGCRKRELLTCICQLQTTECYKLPNVISRKFYPAQYFRDASQKMADVQQFWRPHLSEC